MFLFAWGALSSSIIVILVKLGIDNRLIFGLKDIIIYLVGLIVFARILKSKSELKYVFILLLFLIYLLINSFILNASYVAPLNNIRQIVSPMVIIFIFVYLLSNNTRELKLKRFVLLMHTIMFFFGAFEYITEFWKHFGLHDYFMLKGIPVDVYGLSYMFYEPMLGYQLRMTSTFIDPISAGHYFATMLSFVWFVPIYKGRVKSILIITCLTGLLLCFSKGAFLQVFLMLFVLNNRVWVSIRLIFSTIPFIVILFLPNIKGILIHMNGAYQSIMSASIWGYGVGAVGNYAKMFSDDLTVYHELSISDTFLGMILGQIGAFGILIWLFFMLRLVYLRHDFSAFKMMLSILLVSSLSENTLNVTSFVLPAFLVAWAYSHNLKKSTRNYMLTLNNEK